MERVTCLSQINGVPVLRVWRRGEAAVHVTETPFEVGSQVELEVEWGRRFDHMQQHSGEVGKGGRLIKRSQGSAHHSLGQHLITAIADRLYGLKTTSWLDGLALPIDPYKLETLSYTGI